MKILFLTQFLPFYPNTGGKVKTWAILKSISKLSTVHLLAFIDRKEDVVGVKKVKRYCQKVEVILNPIITLAHQSLKKKAFFSLFSKKPFRVSKHYSDNMVRTLIQMLKQEKYDCVYLDHDVMLQYLDIIKKFSNAKIVLDEHSISSEGAWQNFKIETNLIDKIAYLLETLKWLLFEYRHYRRCDLIFTISSKDKNKITSRYTSPEKVVFLPIPIKKYPKLPYDIKHKNILFIGLMSWKPNADGFWWFVKNVFPIVKECVPDATFTVVGNYPSKSMLACSQSNPSIKVVGYQQYLNPQFQKASVFVVPIRSGSGIRIKLLDTMARGLPCVSTPIGAYGLDVRHNNELLIASDPEKFAAFIVTLLKDSRHRNKISNQGRLFVRSIYSNHNTMETLKRNLMLI